MKLILILINHCLSLKVYQSSLPIESKDGLAGLHYLKSNLSDYTLKEFTNSLSFCLRFHYQKLGATARLLSIGPGSNFMYLSGRHS